MAAQDSWSDFDTYRHSIQYNNTVDKLKQIVQGLNEECGTHISKSGKKQELIDKILYYFDLWKHQNTVDKWTQAKGVLDQVRSSGVYTPGRSSGSSMQASSSMSSGGYSSSSYAKPGYTTPTTIRIDPYNRKNSTVLSPAASSSSSSRPPVGGSRSSSIQWKESPFFQIDQAVSTLVECPETQSSSDRKSQSLSFTLNSEQLEKLKRPGAKYQLRLFCTSSLYWNSTSSFRNHQAACPIEFPPTCEVRVNNVVLTASLKGLKKKAGTAPPPDLGKYIRQNNSQNRIEMVYVNSQHPTQPKKFYLIVLLVETTSVDTLVQNIKQTRFRSSAEILRQLQASVPEDDDIIAGPQKMSLKCPLSFMRVNTPCRSELCTHRQCFDANSWFSVMEQTTTYLCPICERVLNWKDLIIDGSFDDILKACPDSVDDVMVETDGEWHTNDNKYGSVNWKTKHPPIGLSKPPPPPPRASVKTETYEPPLSAKPSTTEKKLATRVDEITILDSEDEDEEGIVKQQLSVASSGGTTTSSQTRRPPPPADDVIDLTLDSDDEEPEPPRNGKRKASDAALSPTEAIWKKSRIDGQTEHTNTYHNDRQKSPQPYSYNTNTLPHSYHARNPPAVNGSSYPSGGERW